MGKNKRKHKIKILFGIGFIFIFIMGLWCFEGKSKAAKKQVHETWILEDIRHSEIAQKDCIICKNRKSYSSENNLSIVLLNSGTVNRIDINKYDDKGKLIEKLDTFSQMTMGPAHGENMGVQTHMNRDRGYAYVEICLGENALLDAEKIYENCCDQCIEQIKNDYYREQPYDILVLNHLTGDIKLITNSLKSFTTGDYFISCEKRRKDGENENSKMELLIFFCPVRYGNGTE